MWKLRHGECFPIATQLTSGRRFVPESVFLTIVFKYNSILSKQSLIWGESLSKEKGKNELLSGP